MTNSSRHVNAYSPAQYAKAFRKNGAREKTKLSFTINVGRKNAMDRKRWAHFKNPTFETVEQALARGLKITKCPDAIPRGAYPVAIDGVKIYY